ncbi:MAG: hypothetical protein UX10_C0028G0007 [Candidatus Magasanikbacteria bacterium GW2011_GWA2_45_39]|uniref:Thymidylate kinase n=1 Tax=Candidatus Magasanikbacteria bacterium GW2011_GWA2_45_39 TaxID=1619041 RepID=A0A0G1ME91_9BACT|nr:MAG: hypothetical protein UX10_C0028G0007 [Candidatus Magasanikbacteria bacterium GW2011_GWA2_45_39]
MGYQELGILRPDLVLFLDVPPDISRKLNRQKSDRKYLKGMKQDIAERRRDHQLAAYKSYLNEVRLNDWWLKIRCLTNDKLELAAAVHHRIWNKLSGLEGQIILNAPPVFLPPDRDLQLLPQEFRHMILGIPRRSYFRRRPGR